MPPLTNGYETRNALDTPGAVLLEASSKRRRRWSVPRRASRGIAGDASRGGAEVLRTLLADLVSLGGRWNRLDYVGEGVLVFGFGPGLTAALILTKRASFSTACCSARALRPCSERRGAPSSLPSSPRSW